MTGVMIVTGGGRGIGAATARLAAARGYAVAINYRSRAAEAEALAREIGDNGGRAVALAADVANEADVVRLFEAADEALGTPTVLVNNAGVLETQMRLADMDADRIDRVFAVNVRGAFIAAREAVRRMSTARGGKGGAIVNVSSIASLIGAPDEYLDYAASKGAVDTLTVGLAREVAAEGIRVNAVRPGVILTEIHASGGEPGRPARVGPSIPMRRPGTAEEVARTILWLASDEASYVTGAIVNVTGGR